MSKNGYVEMENKLCQIDAGSKLHCLENKLEEKWETIRDEALALMDDRYFKTLFKIKKYKKLFSFNFPNFDKEAEGLQKEGDWRQFNLYERGMKNEKNCKHTPKTCRILEPMKEAVECRRGQIKFR